MKQWIDEIIFNLLRKLTTLHC